MSSFADKARVNVPPLQTIVQLTVYRQVHGRFEYLLLKRIDTDSKFWQVITEPLPSSSTLGDTLRQAASEQAGLRGFKHLSHETYSYEWYTHGDRGKDIVFAAEVSPETVVTIDRHRFEDYAWLEADEAVRRLKWEGNRTALRKLDNHLIQTQPFAGHEQLQSNTSDHYDYNHHSEAPQSSPSPTSATPNQADKHSPYGPNVPKRLPDQPATYTAPVKEVNPGEFFL